MKNEDKLINFLAKLIGYIYLGFYTLWIIFLVLFFSLLFGLYCVTCTKFSNFLWNEIIGKSTSWLHWLTMMILIFAPIYLFMHFKGLLSED